MEMEAKCPYCGEYLVDDYGESYLEFDYVVRHVYGYCPNCEIGDFEWDEIYTYQGITNLREKGD